MQLCVDDYINIGCQESLVWTPSYVGHMSMQNKQTQFASDLVWQMNFYLEIDTGCFLFSMLFVCPMFSVYPTKTSLSNS